MRENSSKIDFLLILLALLGLGVSAYLSYEHYAVLQRGFTGKSFCNLNSYFNCDMVLSSRYATLGTIPLAGVGFFFYLYLSGTLIYGKIFSERPARTFALPSLFILFACGVSLGLAYVSFAKLGSFCLFCSSLYAVNFLLLLGFAKFYRFSPTDWMESLEIGPLLKGLAGFLVVFAVGLPLLHLQSKRSKQDIDPAEVEKYLQFFFAQTPLQFDTQDRPYWGNADAKVVLVEFSDFECPFCKMAAFNLKPMLADYKDKVKIVFLNYPLDQSCNSAMPRSGHAHACALAFGARCASEQGKFWEYHDEIFELQPKLSESSSRQVAESLGLDLEKFQNCLQSEETKSRVVADIEQGQKAKVEGTPSIYVDGRKLEYWYIPQVFKKVVESSLDK